MIQMLQGIAPIAAAVIVGLFALPSFVGLIRQRGFGRGLATWLVLALLVLGFETALLKVGMPSAKFSFNSLLGYKILGLTPWLLALVYPPMVLAEFWLASKITQGKGRIILVAISTLIVHAVLDPATAKMRIWEWQTPGPYYGVPLANFAMWFVLGLIAASLLAIIWGKEPVKRSAAYSGFALLWFWSGVNLGLQQWVPGGIGIAAAISLLVVMFFEKRKAKKAETEVES
jgi:bisanhydrobacterioruberin hydratase